MYGLTQGLDILLKWKTVISDQSPIRNLSLPQHTIFHILQKPMITQSACDSISPMSGRGRIRHMYYFASVVWTSQLSTLQLVFSLQLK